MAAGSFSVDSKQVQITRKDPIPFSVVGDNLSFEQLRFDLVDDSNFKVDCKDGKCKEETRKRKKGTKPTLDVKRERVESSKLHCIAWINCNSGNHLSKHPVRIRISSNNFTGFTKEITLIHPRTRKNRERSDLEEVTKKRKVDADSPKSLDNALSVFLNDVSNLIPLGDYEVNDGTLPDEYEPIGGDDACIRCSLFFFFFSLIVVRFFFFFPFFAVSPEVLAKVFGNDEGPHYIQRLQEANALKE
jgi:hypothetical protein